jgi:hypothetical protein
MVDQIPPSKMTPPQPLPPPPKAAGKDEDRRAPQPLIKGGKDSAVPLDSHGISVRLAVLAMEAKEKELSMARIIERAIEETGMTNPQAAMEEVNKHIEKEIEAVLEDIKNNKELMEEAEAWKALGDLLESNLTPDQAQAFIDLVEAQIKGLK